MLQRIQHAVHSNADVQLCWRTFTDWQGWNSFVPGTYKKIEWTTGEPWAVGSRVRMQLLRPFPLVTHCVIIGSSPPKEVGWINHELDNIVEQWVFFKPRASGGTDISMWLEIRGDAQVYGGLDIVEAVRDFKRNWYNCLAAKCDEFASQGGSALIAKDNDEEPGNGPASC